MSKNTRKKNAPKVVEHNPDFLLKMSGADESRASFIFEMLPVFIFSSIVIMIVSEYSYLRPMSQFYWTSDTDYSVIPDFFSYNKMICIIIAASMVVLYLLYSAIAKKLLIYKCFYYAPMLVFSFFVILSYLCSDYRDFSLLGWNDRFEGTIPLLCYMIMLFYTINIVRTEKNVRQLLYCLGAALLILNVLGIFQSVGLDLFKTAFGQKLVMKDNIMDVTDSGFLASEAGADLAAAGVLKYTSYSVHQLIDMCKAIGSSYITFRFYNNEVYQTIYNPNYVSFYLAMTIPLFGILFIYLWDADTKHKYIKLPVCGVLFGIMLYNMICSSSSGGYIGLAAAVLMALAVLNKRILRFIKPIAVLVAAAVIVLVITKDTWSKELSTTLASEESYTSSEGSQITFTKNMRIADSTGVPEFDEGADERQKILDSVGKQKPDIDYFITEKDTVTISLNGEVLIMKAFLDEGVYMQFGLFDENDKPLEVAKTDDIYYTVDERFMPYIYFKFLRDGETSYVGAYTAGTQWLFKVTEDEIFYTNSFGRDVKLNKVPHIGFEGHMDFGTYRGFIWSRTLPLLKDHILTGSGPDTFSAVFPQNDYAGKYTENFLTGIDIIVDKPHNMYLLAGVDTGVISMLALLVLYIGYVAESIRLYIKRELSNEFIIFAGIGLMLGVTGFLAAGLVNDSTVSTMPMFYTVLGTGIAVNRIVRKQGEMKACVDLNI